MKSYMCFLCKDDCKWLNAYLQGGVQLEVRQVSTGADIKRRGRLGPELSLAKLLTLPPMLAAPRRSRRVGSGDSQSIMAMNHDIYSV